MDFMRKPTCKRSARLHARGYTATPVIVTPAGAIALEPNDEELAEIIAATA